MLGAGWTTFVGELGCAAPSGPDSVTRPSSPERAAWEGGRARVAERGDAFGHLPRAAGERYERA